MMNPNNRSRTTIQPVIAVALAAAALACGDARDAGTSAQAALGYDAGVEDAFVWPDAMPPDPLEVVKEFSCSPEFNDLDQPVAEVAGTSDRIFIAAATEPCQFDLVYRPQTGPEVTLSPVPSGYLVVAGADRVVCASPIAHGPVAAGDDQHDIYGVRLECALKATDGTWQPMQTVADPSGAWSPWVTSVIREDATTYTVRYLRDFSFQFINANNEGRPPEDGTYEQTLEIRRGVLVASGPPVKVSSDFTDTSMEDPTPNCSPGEIDPDDPACLEPVDEPVVVE